MSATILEQIFAHKQSELERQRRKVPLARLQALVDAAPPAREFAVRLPDRLALIAEVKKASPSKGVLIENFEPVELARTYATNGATAISVLTDTRFFQGHLSYLRLIREALTAQGFETPLLRKDFLFDEYQIVEARAYGADALLLIVAMLDDATLARLIEQTRALGMTPLVEVHTLEELQRALGAGATLIGVNNRNLHTFAVDLHTTQRIAEALPDTHRPVLVAESGIGTVDDLALLRSWRVDAILVGESIVVAADPAAQVRMLAGTPLTQRNE